MQTTNINKCRSNVNIDANLAVARYLSQLFLHFIEQLLPMLIIQTVFASGNIKYQNSIVGQII